MKPIEIILFDLGGVLVELTGVPTMLAWTCNEYSEEELWEAWLRSPAIRSFETGQSTTEQFAADLIREMKLPVGATEFINTFTMWPRGLFPGVASLLQRLQKDYTLACFSNSNELHWPRLMVEMGLQQLFEHHFASHLIGRLKPDKSAFEYVLQHLGSDASSVLFLDDNELNVNGARKAGMRAARVKGPLQIEQVLRDHGIPAGYQ
ncbi:HAD family phosphatase [bacterium]|nr:HAD family phosphatase [bacterium]